MSDSTFRIGDLFSRSYAIVAGNFTPFAVIALVVSIPSVIMRYMQGPVRFSDIISGHNATHMTSLYLSPFFWVAWVVAIVASFIAYNAFTFGAGRALAGEPVDLQSMLKNGIATFLPLLGAIVVAVVGYLLIAAAFGIAIALGALLGKVGLAVVAVIAGFAMIVVLSIFSIRMTVLLPVLVIEQPGVFRCFARSFQLTKGHAWKIFGLLLLISLAAVVISAINFTFMAILPFMVSIAFGVAVQLVLLPYFLTLFVVLREELRRIKEGGLAGPIAQVFD